MKNKLAVALIIFVIQLPASTLSVSGTEQPAVTGPYVDELNLLIVPNLSQRPMALLEGIAQFDTSYLDTIYLPEIQDDPDISLSEAFTTTFPALVINCAKYPMNLTTFRRAFALSYNKSYVLETWCDGFALLHDSIVPRANPFCAEDQLQWHYYDQDLSQANALLDAAGFAINGTTGWRDSPDGTPLEVIVEYPLVADGGLTSGPTWVAEQALQAVHVNATYRPADFAELMSRVRSNGDFDIAFVKSQYIENKPSAYSLDWLCAEFATENAAVYGQNLARYRNATFDDYRQEYFDALTPEQVSEAALGMQEVLQETVPWLIPYHWFRYQAYRTAEFEGAIFDHTAPVGDWGVTGSIAGQWSCRALHPVGSQTGGSVAIAIPTSPASFNIFKEESPTCALLFDLMYSSLFDPGPGVTSTPDLAQSMTVETHSENLAVPEGNIRFTIDILQNATWSDGVPLTAEDVAYTFNYLLEANTTSVHHIESWSLDSLDAAYAPSPHRVILEFVGESYLHFYTFAGVYIIPKHIFSEEIGVEGWESWDPLYNENDSQVTSGPFEISHFVADQSISMTYNRGFYYLPSARAEETSQTSSGTNSGTGNGFEWGQSIVTAVAVASASVITFCVIVIALRRRGGD